MISTELGHNVNNVPENLVAPENNPSLPINDTTPAHGYLPLNSLSSNSTSSTFEDLLANAPLPPPGPSYYVARRAIWLAGSKLPVPQPQPSTSRQRLEHLLNQPGGIENETVWKGGVEKVWKGLVAGGRLKRRLPMPLVIKIIHAGWLRDPDTWPPGAVAPEPDDVLDRDPTQQPPFTNTVSHSEVTTPWTASQFSSWMAVNAVGQSSVEDKRASGMVVAEH